MRFARCDFDVAAMVDDEPGLSVSSVALTFSVISVSNNPVAMQQVFNRQNNPMVKDPLTEKVIGLAIEVHRNLGPGLLESVYEYCLCKEMSDIGLSFEKQLSVPVVYKGTRMETGFRADIVVDGDLLIEVKAVDKLLAVHEAQVLTYLKLGGFSTGLLINFNTALLKDGVKRFVM